MAATSPADAPHADSLQPSETSKPEEDTPKKRKTDSVNQHGSGIEVTKVSNSEELGGWVGEFQRHCVISPLELPKFLSEYVPSGTPYQAPTVPNNIFHGVHNISEYNMGELLVSGLKEITSPIPKDRRPRFVHTHATTFNPLDSSQHITRPNITVTHVDAPEKDWQWNMCACAIEIKKKKSADPITTEGKCKTATSHHRAIAQLAKNGRNLLLGNVSCFVFVLGIYNNCARIFRFDRSGVIISDAFQYDNSHAILGEFFWRLVHPINGILDDTMPSPAGRLVGSDPTISRPTKTEAKLMADRIQKHHPQLDVTPDDIERHSLWVGAEWSRAEVAGPFAINQSSPHSCPVRCLTIGKALWQSTGLFSRATMVWRVVCENYEETLYALKDSWRERCRLPESYFYDRIETYVQEQGLLYEGIATLIGSVDLGERYPDSGHRTRSAELRPTPSSPEVTTEPLPSEQPSQQSTPEHSLHQPSLQPSLQEPSFGQSAPPGSLPSTPPATSSSSCLLDIKDSSPHDRNHMRTITWPVGERLSEYMSTKELIQAIRSAIKGHKLALSCGVLHRDISPGNVLMANIENLAGFIHDFDHSLAIPRPGEHVDQKTVQAIERKLKDITGTYQFMAIGILRQNPHKAHHDLESFYWLTIWCLLRHADHDRGVHACQDLLDAEGKQRVNAKVTWLVMDSAVDIKGNVSLSQLLKELGSLFEEQMATSKHASKPITYEAILQVLDYALAKVWPEGDRSRPFNSPQDSTATLESQAQTRSGQKRKTDSGVKSGGNQKKVRGMQGASSRQPT